MDNQPIMRFQSHIAGKNANVTLYRDRVEWNREQVNTTAAVLTLGASLLLPKKKSHEVIPVRAISSVTMKSGMVFSVVSVICSGNTIDFRATNAAATEFRNKLLELML